MVWPSQLKYPSKTITSVLKYSHYFNYPLTSEEIWYWQIKSHLDRVKIGLQLKKYPTFQKYYYFPGGRSGVLTRKLREKYSQKKWTLLPSIVNKLTWLPTISSVFVTGALSMNNSPKDDDIDLMFITYPNTLWITRFFVSLYLKVKGQRRDPYLPEHSSARVNNKICDNLWIDSNSFSVFSHDLYRAHEILQAKCIFDRGGIHQTFLTSNSWVGEFLPIAYKESVKKFPTAKTNNNFQLPFAKLSYLFWLPNFVFFLFQYLYMLPRKKGERIGLGFAFFHPDSTLPGMILSIT